MATPFLYVPLLRFWVINVYPVPTGPALQNGHNMVLNVIITHFLSKQCRLPQCRKKLGVLASEVPYSLMLRLPGRIDDLHNFRSHGAYAYDDPELLARESFLFLNLLDHY